MCNKQTCLRPFFRDDIKEVVLDVPLYNNLVVPCHGQPARDLAKNLLVVFSFISVGSTPKTNNQS